MEAERKTPVEVALVKVQFPKKERRSSIIDRLQREKTVKETVAPNTNQLVETILLKQSWTSTSWKWKLDAG